MLLLLQALWLMLLLWLLLLLLLPLLLAGLTQLLDSSGECGSWGSGNRPLPAWAGGELMIQGRSGKDKGVVAEAAMPGINDRRRRGGSDQIN